MLEIKELTINDFDDIKNLFKGVFTAPPWNDDWSDENQLNEYLLDLMKVRNPLDFGLFRDGELIGISIEVSVIGGAVRNITSRNFALKPTSRGKVWGRNFLN